MIRIGILGHVFTAWGGGIDLLRIIIGSLLAVEDIEADIHVLVPDRGPIAAMKSTFTTAKAIARNLLRRDFSPIKQFAPKEIVEHSLAEFSNRIHIHHIDLGHRSTVDEGKRLKLDVLLPSYYSLGKHFPIPWVGYVYDFQHKYYPGYFKRKDCTSRDRQLRSTVTEARSVIVNARDVAHDVSKFIPEATAKIFCLPFAAAPQLDWLTDAQGTLEKYQVREPYFIISNQFWIHKDHKTAFSAFRQIAREHEDISLVCTGHTYDYRHPHYFRDLIEDLERSGVRNRIRILGLIRKRDQIELMKHALAVVQPTLFEGGPGGGSGFDAISLGIPLIASDIPVNREIGGPGVRYFTPSDVPSLTAALLTGLATRSRSPRSREALLNDGAERRRSCGNALMAAISCSMGCD